MNHRTAIQKGGVAVVNCLFRGLQKITLLGVFAAGVAQAAGSSEPVALDTEQGALEGATSISNPDIAVFKHIPYALPPVGQRRWRHAEAAPGWSGTRLATGFSPACIQPPYPQDSFYARAATPTSEDCLYLNVWTPRAAIEPVAATLAPESDAATSLPVMVWIHGGGLTRGAGSIGTYDGTALAAKGVVLVTLNYRLGVFGYMAHPAASAESSLGVSGNYGTSDQIQALQWVQDNIAAYGGDPDNVTIFGESAGSWSVHHMLASPRAKGLFHRAIGQSGARFGRMPSLKGDARSAHAQGVKLQTALSVESLAGLRELPAEDVLAAGQRLRFGGVHDGVFFPEQLHSMFAGHRYNVVPVLLGYNAEEGTTLGALTKNVPTPAQYTAEVEKNYPDSSAALLEIYPADDPMTSRLALFRDTAFGHGMHAWGRFNAQKEKDTYLYYFTHKPLGDPLGAFHAAEIAYAFNNVASSGNADTASGNADTASGNADTASGNADTDTALAELISDYWVAFAKTGKPKVEGAPAWPRYSARKPQYLEFTAQGAKRGRDLMGKDFRVLDKALNQLRKTD